MIIYIHIPFCDSKCGYCAFNSYSNQDDKKQDYMKALSKQLLFELKEQNIKASSVFFGGGTPSSVKPSLYSDIFRILDSHIEKNAEITLEANPNAFSLDSMKEFVDFGVNRFSFGVQSFYDDKLAFLEREHKSLDIKKTINDAKNAGCKNINIDLMYETPFDSKERLKSEIYNANNLGVSHISMYALTLESGSSFFRKSKDWNFREESCYEVKENLAYYGFNQYEVSNFAKDSVCKHNLSYWNSDEYIGVGAGAFGRIGLERYVLHKNISKYIENPFYKDIEKLSENDMKTEAILLGLRSNIGVFIDILDLQKVKILEENDKIFIKNDKIFAKDYFLADSLALFLA